MALTTEQRDRVYWLVEGHMDEDFDDDEDGTRYDAECERRFTAFETSEELFLFAYHSSGDLTPDEWRRVIDNPLCDRGTALVVFWRNSPVYVYEHPDADDDRSDLVRDIERRYLAGAFPDRGLRFDPAEFREVNFLLGHPPGAVERVPEELRRPSPGEPVDLVW